ncbi:unnamed protein product [Adineta steineri]|uniref:Uncharacterized protein n=1 Tax=Adineta steineri TaxID=433720 RepID=A0A814XHD6_9BILA|nr:unnamed protein product [Adineta steineri]CAF3840779.1 unnamed protein product [Adineta steineri]
MSTAHLSTISVRNKLQYDMKNVKLVYASSYKLQSQSALATEYWFDWRVVNIATKQNIDYTIEKDIGDIDSKCDKISDGCQCSTYYRNYWQLYWEMNEKFYKINKNNAQVNVWKIDDRGELEITVLNEGDQIRLDFKLPSGNACFYGEIYEITQSQLNKTQNVH